MRGFRVWYKKENRWLRGEEFKLSADGSVSTYGIYTSETKLVRCDSTGLKDKDGKEIYEGDVVRVPRGYSGDHSYPECIADIRYIEAGFELYNSKDKWGFVMQEFSWSDIEILGNIYESPELVKP